MIQAGSNCLRFVHYTLDLMNLCEVEVHNTGNWSRWLIRWIDEIMFCSKKARIIGLNFQHTMKQHRTKIIIRKKEKHKNRYRRYRWMIGIRLVIHLIATTMLYQFLIKHLWISPRYLWNWKFCFKYTCNNIRHNGFEKIMQKLSRVLFMQNRFMDVKMWSCVWSF